MQREEKNLRILTAPYFPKHTGFFSGAPLVEHSSTSWLQVGRRKVEEGMIAHWGWTQIYLLCSQKLGVKGLLLLLGGSSQDQLWVQQHRSGGWSQEQLSRCFLLGLGAEGRALQLLRWGGQLSSWRVSSITYSRQECPDGGAEAVSKGEILIRFKNQGWAPGDPWTLQIVCRNVYVCYFPREKVHSYLCIKNQTQKNPMILKRVRTIDLRKSKPPLLP